MGFPLIANAGCNRDEYCELAYRAGHLLGVVVRYHKAIEITKPEADFIIATGTSTLSDIVVVSQGGKFYDVRALSRYELDAFLADLARAECALEGGVPH